MRIAYIAAGAAGMYCGTCIHDNTLAAALIKLGCEVALVPTYTPLRTDEEDVSIGRVFYGGINVYLQLKSALFRHTPRLLDRALDNRRLLNSLSRFSASTSAEDLGELTLSVLQGEEGRQKKELEKLVDWLEADFKPDVVVLTNSMFIGFARPIRRRLGVPVLCALQGEDIFLEDLVEPYKTKALKELRRRAGEVDGFIAPCTYYADFMSDYLQVPPQRIDVVELGITLAGHGQQSRRHAGRFTLGYLARICPEKGLHILVEAFALLAQKPQNAHLHLEVAGYLGKRDEAYFDDLKKQLEDLGLADRCRFWGEVDRQQKIEFLSGLDAFSVPTVYREPKGLFLLEAMANGVPVVQPEHGAFPQMLEATGGGLLVSGPQPEAVAAGIERLMEDDALRQRLGEAGKKAVHANYGEATMAQKTLAVLRRYAKGQS